MGKLERVERRTNPSDGARAISDGESCGFGDSVSLASVNDGC